MEPLDAFLLMWERARATFGEGVPHDRTEFDKSAELRGLQDQVKAAGPGSHWTGGAADRYADANHERRSHRLFHGRRRQQEREIRHDAIERTVDAKAFHEVV